LIATPQQQTKEAIEQERDQDHLQFISPWITTMTKALKSVSSLNFVAFLDSIASNGKK
jgi:hypothetical protein